MRFSGIADEQVMPKNIAMPRQPNNYAEMTANPS
jgi:hypothetical protein